MQKKQFHYAWLIMISCCTIAITGPGIIIGCAGIFFRPVSQYLGIGIGSFSLYFTIQMLVMSFLQPVATKIMQKYSLRIILSIASTVQIVTFMLMSQFTSVTQFYIAAVIIGVASSFILLLAIPTLMGAWFQKNLGTFMGIAYAFSGLSGAIFNPIGSYFITTHGWRMAYLLLGGIGAVIILPFMYFIVRDKPSDIGLLPYGAEEISKDKITQIEEISAFSTKKSVKSSIFYMALFTALSLGLAAGIANHIPGYIVSIGFSATVAASVLSFYMIGVICGKILMGFLNDKIGMIGAISIFGIISGIGAMILLLHPGGIAILLGGAALLGISGSGATILPPLLVRTLFDQKDFSTIYSYVAMVTGIVTALVVSIYAFIYDLTGSYYYDFIIVLAAILLAVANIVLAAKKRKKMINFK